MARPRWTTTRLLTRSGSSASVTSASAADSGVSVYTATAADSISSGPVLPRSSSPTRQSRSAQGPKALLEAMGSNTVTIEGETRRLPDPFFVIATQNPSHLIGTFPLPESQLDRFLMRIELRYPDSEAERALLQGEDRRDLLAHLKSSMDPKTLMELQREAQQVYTSGALLDYIQALVGHTRQAPEFAHGLSPRAALAVLHAARAWALMENRRHVLPEDVQAVLPGVVAPPGIRQ